MLISARYWRLIVEGNAAVWQPSEIGLKLAGVSVSASKPVTASSTLSPSFAPANAVDGNLFSSYCNQNNQFPVIFDIDLLVPSGVDELNISHINSYSAKQIILQCSFDKVTWFEIERFENLVSGWSEDPAVSRSFPVSRNRFEVIPDAGVAAGARPVRLRSKVGEDLSAVSGVEFGGVAATGVVHSGKDILCVTPAHSIGPVDVLLISSENETAYEAYTYVEVAPIAITQVPVLSIELHSSAVKLSQFAVLTIDVPVRPILTTQALGVTPVLERDVPFPEPFLASPDGDLTESLAWMTTVFIANNGREQRQALITKPKIRLAVETIFTTEEERRAFYDIINQYEGGYISWPLYQYGVHLEPSNIGDSTLRFNRDIDDLREGEQAAIYDAHTGKTHVVTVSELNLTGCVLSNPLTFEVTRACQIFPMVRLRMLEPGSITTDSISGSMKLQLESETGRDLVRVFDNLQLKTFDGIPIIDKLQITGVDDTYSKGVEWSDTGTAIAGAYTPYRVAYASGSRVFKANRYNGEMNYWRNLFTLLNGQQGVFLLPSFFDDLPLVGELEPDAIDLITSNLQVEKYLFGNVNKVIRIQTDTSVLYRKIVGTRVLFDAMGQPNSIRLTLNQSLGAPISVDQIESISFCPKARLNSDEVKLTHMPLDTYIEIEYRTVDQ